MLKCVSIALVVGFVLGVLTVRVGEVSAAEPQASSALWVADFERGYITDYMTYSGNSTSHIVYASQGAPTRAGVGSAYIVLDRARSANTYRSEIQPNNGPGLMTMWEQEYWIGFSFWLEDWGIDRRSAEFVYQLHSRPGLDATGREDWSCAEGRNPISLRIDGPDLALLVINDPRTTPSQVSASGNRVWSEPFQSNTWYDFVIHARISPGENGFIRVWRNGELIYERFGGNVDILDGCGRPKVPAVYNKWGVYKWDWRSDSFVSDVSERRLYYDEIRIGDVSAGYTGGYLGVTPPDQAVRVHVLGLGETISGPVELQPAVMVREGYEVASVRVLLDGEEIYSGREPSPRLDINRGELSDGAHELVVEVADGEGEIHTYSRKFAVANTRVGATPPGEATGLLAPIRIVTSVPAEEIAKVEVLVDSNLVYSGERVPDELMFDARSVEDGAHPVEVAITTLRGAESRASTTLNVNTHWVKEDRLRAPVDLGPFFGVLTLSIVTERSGGWDYKTGEPQAFLGDGDRMTRRSQDVEYLVFDTPQLRSFKVIVYVRNPLDVKQVSLAVQWAGGEWTPQPFAVTETGVSAAGWHRLELTGTVAEELAAERFRVVLEGTPEDADAWDLIQLGHVELRGRQAWAQ